MENLKQRTIYSIFNANTIYIDSKQKQTHTDAANSATSWTLDPVGYAATVGVVVRFVSIVVDCLLPLILFVLRTVEFLLHCLRIANNLRNKTNASLQPDQLANTHV